MTREASTIAREPENATVSGLRSQKTLDEGPHLADEAAITELIAFFKLLDKWDREVSRHAKVM
jgi:hypothetical protein